MFLDLSLSVMKFIVNKTAAIWVPEEKFAMRRQIESILKNYKTVSDEKFSGNSSHLAIVALGEIVKELIQKFAIEKDSILVKASYGHGEWAKVPWIAFFDKRVTENAMSGIYAVFLFKSDMSGFYLSLSKASGSNQSINQRQAK